MSRELSLRERFIAKADTSHTIPFHLQSVILTITIVIEPWPDTQSLPKHVCRISKFCLFTFELDDRIVQTV